MEKLFTEIKNIVVTGKHAEIEALVERAIADGANSAMDVVGQRFAASEIFVPEMLVSAMTMKKGLDIIKPLLKEDESQSKGKVVLCTVKGDLHDIGKNLVAMMLEGAGFEVIDLGVDATVDTVMSKIKQLQPDVLGLSALLTTTMSEMEKVINALEKQGIRDRVRVMIGGAPVGADFAEKIGADAYGEDAAEAVTIARKMIGN
jgi:methylmalonyl-CoA mutase cobalamin-binding domain/chain